MAQDNNDQPILMGRTSFRTLMVRPYFDWFRKPYDDYAPNPSAMDVLRQKSTGISFIVFGGTWCEDTKVPTFIMMKNGVEIGRITESVSQSVEADLADLLSR